MSTRDPVQELLDRQAIADCVHRYARGIDRRDAELVASCYHPDAIDDHGTFVGSGRDLAEWVFERQEGTLSTQNHITTHRVELDGDTAHGETYYIVLRRSAAGPVSCASGRYVDRFERRDGEWRIAGRVCIVESIAELPAGDMSHRDRLPALSARDRSDVSYQRPLAVRTSPNDPQPVPRASG